MNDRIELNLSRRSLDIHIERSRGAQGSITVDDYGEYIDDEEEDR